MDNSNWQTELSCVRERNQYAYNKSLFCDVEFSVVDSNGDKATIAANKYVLAISSPVFEAMFYGQLAETGRTIHLQDCSKEELQEMLRYVYSDEIQLTGSNVMEVLILANKYILPFLVKECNDYLQENLTPEDVFNVLPQAEKIQNAELQQLCWDVIESETLRAVASESFVDISREMLCDVLGKENIHIQEIEVFKAVDRWVSKKIKEGNTRRAVLGDEAVRLIRFPLISQAEFVDCVLESNILKESELIDMVKLFNDKVPGSEFAFNSKRRRGQWWGKRWSKCRFQGFQVFNKRGKNTSTQHMSYYVSVPDVAVTHPTAGVQFKINKPVRLAGLRLVGGCKDDDHYSVDLKIYKTHLGPDETPVFQTTTTTFTREKSLIDDLYHGFTFPIDIPIPLDANVSYTIVAEIEGPANSYSGVNGKAVVEIGDVKITFSKSLQSQNGINFDCGQFPSILLERK